MIELLIWGTIIIVTAAISSISIVLGIYYMLTKNKKNEQVKKEIYKLDDQREIT